jgi:hypothetical protein
LERSPGSVIVDYVVWLRGLENREVDTGQLKKVFYKAVDGLSRHSGAGGGAGASRAKNAGGASTASAAASTGATSDRRNRQKSLGGKQAVIPDRVTLGAYTLDPFYTDFVGQ